MHASCPQSKLSGVPRDKGQVTTRFYALEGHQGDFYPTECEGSAVGFGASQLL